MLSRKEISAEKTAVTVYTLTKGVSYVISSDRNVEAISPYPQEDESNVPLSRSSRMSSTTYKSRAMPVMKLGATGQNMENSFLRHQLGESPSLKI